MSIDLRVLLNWRTAASALSLLCMIPAIDAQVTVVPKVVVDAQLGFDLTASGAPIHLANPAGVAVAADGTIYVADSSNSRIVEILTEGAIRENPVTDPARVVGTAVFLAPSSGLGEPNAVAVAPDGTLYFSDAGKKLLYRVTHPKSESPVYTQLTYSANQSPSALAVDTAGDLWVADGGLKEIIEFAPSATSASQRASVKPLIPTGIAVSASAVYFSDATTNAVYGEGSETPLLAGFSGRNFDFAADHAASHPTGLGLDGAGNLFVLDAENNRLVEFNPSHPSTAFLVPFSKLGALSSLAVGPTGNLYITDHSRDDLNQLVYDGNAINFGVLPAGTDSSAVTLNYSFNGVASVTRPYQRMHGKETAKFSFNDNGCITRNIRPGYTCQQQVHVNYGAKTAGLQKGVVGLSNESAEPLGTIESFAVSVAAVVDFYPGILSYLPQTPAATYPALAQPQAIAVNATDMFVADLGGTLNGGSYTYAGNVWAYPLPQGTVKAIKVGGSPVSLVAPSALALSAAGNLYIADYSLGTVYYVTPTNLTTLHTVSITGSGVKLYHPIALTFDPAGNLYIGDTGPLQALASTSSPGFIVKVPVGGGNATTLYYTTPDPVTPGKKDPVVFPQALATDTHGNLYIADAGDNLTTTGDLVVVPANTGTAALIPTTGYTLNQPSGLSFDPALNLYVLDGYNSRVLVLPVALANDGTPTVGAAAPLPQNIPVATGSNLFVWPGGQRMTLTDIGYDPYNPITQVVTLNTQTANVAFGAIPVKSSQTQSITAINVGNQAAALAPHYTETGDTTPPQFAGPVNPCSGSIAVQQQCTLNFTYSPTQAGNASATFNFFVNNSAIADNFVDVSGSSTKSTPTVTINSYSTPLTYPNGTQVGILVQGNFGTPTGTVKLYDGTTLLTATAVTVTANGQAYYTIPNGTLSAGTHSLTAVYSGDNTYNGGTSAAVNIVVYANTSMTGGCFLLIAQTNTFTCDVLISATGTANPPPGSVVFTIDGVPTTEPILFGASLIFKDFSKGHHTVIVTYAQQGIYSAASLDESFTY